MKRQLYSVGVVIICAGLLRAQTTVDVSAAELSVPFGTVSGKLVTVGEYLVFIDEDRPEASFALSRGEVQNLKVEQDTVSFQAARPVRDRSGERADVTAENT
jgi:hypothetical protein